MGRAEAGRDRAAALGDLFDCATRAACMFGAGASKGARREGPAAGEIAASADHRPVGAPEGGARGETRPRHARSDPPPADPKAAKRARSSTSFHAGLAAEESVARRYARAGLTIVARRWRGRSGEIDLVARGRGLVFVEVKASASHEAAAARLLPRQVARLQAAAEEYLATQPEGALTPCRFDLATVDARGRVRVLANAFGH